MSAGKYRKEQNCLNCGAHVEKHYCSDCGQPNLELKESFWGFIGHSIAHYFHFNNKFFNTVSPLLIRPGKVTLDYLAGKRARYVNPVSLYIFVSIVYFLVVAAPKNKQVEHNYTEVAPIGEKKYANAVDSLKNVLQHAGIGDSAIINNTVVALDRSVNIIDFKKLSFDHQETVLKHLKAENDSSKSAFTTQLIANYTVIHIARNDSTYAAYLSRQNKLPVLQRDGWLKKMIKKRSISIGEKSEVIQETLEHNRPKQYFMLMPLLALFIMWNFRKNHIYYLNHLIFTIHGMTAYFIVQIFTGPLEKYIFGKNSIITNIIELVVTAWVCWYMYSAFKIFYQRKTATIIFKMFCIIVLYYIALSITEMVMTNLIYYVAT